jgi:hypothetical protein
MLGLVVLWAGVLVREEVVGAEGLGAVLALEREEVDEAAERVGALVADVEQPLITVGCACARHGWEGQWGERGSERRRRVRSRLDV